MIQELLDGLDLKKALSVREGFASFQIEFELDFPFTEQCEKVIALLPKVSTRDSATLTFTISGEVESTAGDEASLQRVKQHIEEAVDDESVRVVLAINKAVVNSTLSIYSIDAFSCFIKSMDIKDFMISLSDRFQETLRFEVFSELEDFGSRSIQFYSSSRKDEGAFQITQEAKSIRAAKKELFKENCVLIGVNINEENLLPSDLNFDQGVQYPDIRQKFSEACATLSLIFLANSSEVKSDGKLIFRFHGYKTVTYADAVPEDICKGGSYLQKIFEWCYEGGNGADKIGLVRNIVSIHLDSDGRPVFDKHLLDAILSNYQIYLRGNIQSYLEVKNKIGELLVDFIGRTSAISDDLLGSLKNNVAIIATFLLTVVVVNGLKDNGETAIFSNVYLGIVFLVTAISALWLVLLKRNLKDRFDSVASSLQETIKINYGRVLLPDEISECVNPAIDSNRSNLDKDLDGYARLWKILLGVFMALYFAGNAVFVEKSVSSNVCEFFSSMGAAFYGKAANAKAANKAEPANNDKNVKGGKAEPSSKDHLAAPASDSQQKKIPGEPGKTG